MNNDALLSLLRLISARADGDIAGPSVDAKIDELIARNKANDDDLAAELELGRDI